MKFVSNIVLSVAAIFFVATDNSFAQSYALTPGDTISLNGAFEDLETLSIQQFNNGNDTILLKWEKVSESVPPLWEATVCDNSICYTSLVDSGIMNPILPTEYGLLLLHITPHVNYGTAIIRYTVWDIATPSLKDTLTYILTVNNPLGLSEPQPIPNFSIKPNPAKQKVIITSTLQKGFTYTLSDISGLRIKKGYSKDNSISISTSGIPNGIYNISITLNNNTSTKQLLVQH